MNPPAAADTRPVTVNAAIRLRDIPRYMMSADSRTRLRVAAAADLALYESLILIHGRSDAWRHYLRFGGIIRFDKAGDPWILVEVT